MRADGVLLLGFGGVTETCCGRKDQCPGRVECFVSKVLDDDPKQAVRVAEVAEHYHHLGGVSTYNPLTFKQAEALEQAFAAAGTPVPVRCGFRNYTPWYRDGLQELYALGCRQIAVAVLAAHQTQRSWDQYIDEAHEAAMKLGDAAPTIIGACDPWWNAPGFIKAQAELIQATTVDWDSERFAKAGLILTAHAIPVPAERRSPYRQQVEETARLVAEAAGHPVHTVAFQSAPDESRIPWSSPKVDAIAMDLVAAGATDILVQSVGFLVDHVEVVYDLDHELKECCDELGVTYTRAPCVHDHPFFIETLRERIAAV